MKLYTNDVEWVIAADIDDAWEAWSEHTGGERPDCETEWDWVECDPGSELRIWCDSDGDPCEPGEDGSALVTKKAVQWVERGRGFLCSTEH